MTKSDEVFLFKFRNTDFLLDSFSQMFWFLEKNYTISEDSSENISSFISFGNLIKENKNIYHQRINNKIRYLQKFNFFVKKKQEVPLNTDKSALIDCIVINPSTACNSDCWYCYVNHLRKSNSKELTTDQIKGLIEKVVEANIKLGFDKQICFSYGYTSEITLSFDQFLEVNTFIENIQKEKNIQISFFPSSTNLLRPTADFIDFMNTYGYLTVSLDYENLIKSKKVVKNLELFDDSMVKHCYVPISSETKDYYSIYVECLKHFDISSLRPVRISKDAKYPWTQDNLNSVEKELSKLILTLLELDEKKLLEFLNCLGSSDYFGRYLEKILTREKHLTRCPAGRTAVAIDWNGDYYPCSGLIGIEDFKLGSLQETNLENISRKSMQEDVNGIETCSKCGIKYYCGGPCLDWQVKEGGNALKDVNSIECKMNHIYFRAAAYFVYETIKNYPGLLKKFVDKKKKIFRLDYPLNWETFVSFFTK